MKRAAVGTCLWLLGAVTYAQPPEPEPLPLPAITLEPGQRYFSVDGTPTVLLGTNPTGWMPAQFETLLDWAGVSERIVRIHVTNGRSPAPETPFGQVDEAWARFWDRVFRRGRDASVVCAAGLRRLCAVE